MAPFVFEVAGIRFSINFAEETFGENIKSLLDNYEPFLISQENSEVLFKVNVFENREPVEYVRKTAQEEEGQEIICGLTKDGRWAFDFLLLGVNVGLLVASSDYRSAELFLTGKSRKFAVNNALMVMYALATASEKVALFHAAVIGYEGRGYMFLGVSGTGKSTHASLWLRHIAGTELLNDDNPVVRLENGQPFVYGSPWSGKTPCYKNKKLPLGGIVQLSQAPHNKIYPIGGVEAYVTVMTSISGMRWDRKQADGLHHTENELARWGRLWHLECLPDEAAAVLCCNTVKVANA